MAGRRGEKVDDRDGMERLRRKERRRRRGEDDEKEKKRRKKIGRRGK